MNYQLAKVEVGITPSLEGAEGALKSEFKGVGALFGRELSSGASRGVRGIGGALGRQFSSIGRNLGRTLSSTISNSIKVAGGAALAGAGAVAGQAFAGGFNREITVKDSQARFLAMGKTAKDVSAIMENVSNSVNGTQYGMGEAAKVASQLLNAGVQSGTELEKQLQRITKISDISGSSFEEMGSIYSKIMSGNIVFTEDVNQLADRGIAIYDALGKEMGKSFSEVREEISDGKVDFELFSRALDNIKWDSSVYALNSVTASFKNLRAQLSIMGGNFLSPVVSQLPKVFVNLSNGIKELRNTKAFQNFLARVQSGTNGVMEQIEKLSKSFEGAMSNSGVKKFFDYITNLWKDFKNTISGKELLAGGAGLGIVGVLLQQIPIVGTFFSNINPLVGTFIGFVAQLFSSSERLRGAIADLVGGFDDFGRSFSESFSSVKIDNIGNFESIGDSIASFIEKINLKSLGASFGENVGSFIGTFSQYLPLLKDNLGELFNTVKDSLSNGSALEGKSFGEILGTILGTGLSTSLEVLNTLLPTAIEVVKLIGTALTSDVAKGIFGAIGNMASWLADNETVLFAGLGILGSLFVAGKFGLPFWLALSSNSTVAGAAIGTLGTSMATAGAGLIKGMASIGTAVIASAKPLAALAGLILSVGGIIALLNKIGVFDALSTISSTISSFITDILGGAAAAISTILDTVLSNADKIGQFILDSSSAIGGIFVDYTNSIGGLVTVLAENGVSAGAGSAALATGLLALSGALVSLSGANIGSSISGKIGSIVSGTEGSAGNFSAIIKDIQLLSTEFSKFSRSTVQSGTLTGTGFVNSLSMSIRSGVPTLQRELINLTRQLQNTLDNNRLQIRVDSSGINTASRGNTYSNTYNNSNTTFRIGRVSTIDDILRKGR